MTTRQQRIAARGRRLETAAAAVTVVVAGALCAAVPAEDTARERRTAGLTMVADGVSRPEAVDTRPPLPEAGFLPRAEPERLRIPQLGTDVAVYADDAEDDGTPPVPDEDDAERAVWYQGGPSPGEQGPALVIGHLDTDDGPAAFAGLGALEPGAEVRVDRADGSTALFTVDSVEQYAKDDFPNERVYGPTRTAQLRLITCGGDWSEEEGYDANIVAFASLRN
ncbi:class F sortase [Streptomyces sp. TRM 70351]|uniref:class F sortase n=1 Tax=Streptomyces sp. TRM 70351 TaxID=3116552 RepID=UPI002E7BA02D|nr:class F sortase [Streptomyces sp. TRM 70351]MEE1929874.1 class F sortase [Streptomyces sp. TRM 70351]